MLSASHVKNCREIAWELAHTSQFNVCYYQEQVGRLKRLDAVIKLVPGLTALAGVAALLRTVAGGRELAVTLGMLSGMLSVVGTTLRIPDKALSLGVLLAEYVAHVHTFESLYQFGCTDDSVKAALEAYAKTEQREVQDHPKPNQRLLEKSRKIVLGRIGPPATATP